GDGRALDGLAPPAPVRTLPQPPLPEGLGVEVQLEHLSAAQLHGRARRTRLEDHALDITGANREPRHHITAAPFEWRRARELETRSRVLEDRRLPVDVDLGHSASVVEPRLDARRELDLTTNPTDGPH